MSDSISIRIMEGSESSPILYIHNNGCRAAMIIYSRLIEIVRNKIDNFEYISPGQLLVEIIATSGDMYRGDEWELIPDEKDVPMTDNGDIEFVIDGYNIEFKKGGNYDIKDNNDCGNGRRVGNGYKVNNRPKKRCRRNKKGRRA